MFINTTSPRFTTWRKSTRSDGGSNCVEVATAEDGSGLVGVCDSKSGSSGDVLTFAAGAWTAFIANIPGGRTA